MTAGNLAYDTYCNDRKWKSVRGEQLPKFDDQSDDLKSAWEAAAMAVLNTDAGRDLALLNYQEVADEREKLRAELERALKLADEATALLYRDAKKHEAQLERVQAQCAEMRTVLASCDATEFSDWWSQKRSDALSTDCGKGYAKDDPELDGTDAAHPAWWRGNDAGAISTALKFEQLLKDSSHDSGVGAADARERMQQNCADAVRKIIKLADLKCGRRMGYDRT